MRLLPLSLLLLLAAPALAQQYRYVTMSSGTGFFINRQGDVITNAHVVRGCRSISLLTADGETPARLLAHDEEHDLAVLRTEARPTATVPLRWNISDLREGDSVVVMGFPGAAGAKGHSSFVKTKVLRLEGPAGEPHWIQLSRAAEKGNSGGPVLDGTGNVIAVVSGKAQLYRLPSDSRGEPELVGSSDVAVTLSALKDFLQENAIPFYESASGLVAYSDEEIARQTAKFIVPVHCITG